jgi:hypothetical protein
VKGPPRGGRALEALALLFAVVVVGCAGDGVIDLLPAGAMASASASVKCPPAPRPRPSASASASTTAPEAMTPPASPAMMPGKPMPPADACEGGPCPPMMPDCVSDAAASPVDPDVVTP